MYLPGRYFAPHYFAPRYFMTGADDNPSPTPPTEVREAAVSFTLHDRASVAFTIGVADG